MSSKLAQSVSLRSCCYKYVHKNALEYSIFRLHNSKKFLRRGLNHSITHPRLICHTLKWHYYAYEGSLAATSMRTAYVTVADTDECALYRAAGGRRRSKTPICNSHEHCVNTVGSYVCRPTASCVGGFTVDPLTRRCVGNPSPRSWWWWWCWWWCQRCIITGQNEMLATVIWLIVTERDCDSSLRRLTLSLIHIWRCRRRG